MVRYRQIHPSATDRVQDWIQSFEVGSVESLKTYTHVGEGTDKRILGLSWRWEAKIVSSVGLWKESEVL